jgi:hypothetical protein
MLKSLRILCAVFPCPQEYLEFELGATLAKRYHSMKTKFLLLAALLVTSTSHAGNRLTPGISGITLGLTAQQQKDRLEGGFGSEVLNHLGCAKSPKIYPDSTTCLLKVPEYTYFGAPVNLMTYLLVNDRVVRAKVEFEKSASEEETAANMTKVAKGLERYVSMPMTLRWAMTMKLDDGSLLNMNGYSNNKFYLQWTAKDFLPKNAKQQAVSVAKAQVQARKYAPGMTKEDIEAEEAIRYNYAIRMQPRPDRIIRTD